MPRVPNPATVKAIEELECGKGKAFTDAEALFADLERGLPARNVRRRAVPPGSRSGLEARAPGGDLGRA